MPLPPTNVACARPPAQDIAERGWGLRCVGYFVTGGTDHLLYSDPKNTAEFNPRTGSAVLASEKARHCIE